MKRRSGKRFALLILWLLFLLSLPVRAQVQVSLKLYGGYSYVQGGEGNEGSKGFTDYWKAIARHEGFDYSTEYQPFHYGLDTGGDLIIYFSPVVGIGLGSGYMEAKKATTIDLKAPGVSALISVEPKVSAIPIKASLYLSLPLGSRTDLTLHGGAGYYLAKFASTFRLEEEHGRSQYDQEAKGTGIGYQAGGGLEIDLTPRIGLFIEGLVRYVKIGNFEGTETFSDMDSSNSESGKLYFFKVTSPTIGPFPILQVYGDTLEGPNISDVREAKIDLSGASVRAGIILRF